MSLKLSRVRVLRVQFTRGKSVFKLHAVLSNQGASSPLKPKFKEKGKFKIYGKKSKKQQN